ncbi:hypothetical protein [Pseudomonas syringae group genomosp. 3]|uniref:hypothetical protein n=1 Tax=Pseudomonas syringae group genomosp. 3 TaxID=251701 RepID=UPI0007105527|nr:hypothetical protein [Pseudomonas syringae group genomosp. 3]
MPAKTGLKALQKMISVYTAFDADQRPWEMISAHTMPGILAEGRGSGLVHDLSGTDSKIGAP